MKFYTIHDNCADFMERINALRFFPKVGRDIFYPLRSISSTLITLFYVPVTQEVEKPSNAFKF